MVWESSIRSSSRRRVHGSDVGVEEGDEVHELQVDMQATYRVTAFSQKPRTGAGNATVKDYIFYLSEDGVTFTEVARGSFAPGDQLHTVEIAPTAARYWSFVALSEQDGGNQASTDEIFLRGSPIVAPARPSPPVMVE